MRKKALVVGGTSGLGLSIAHRLLENGYSEVNVLGRNSPEITREGLVYHRFNLAVDDFSFLTTFSDIETLVFAAGIGRVASFEEITDVEIINSFQVNTIGAIRTIKSFYDRINSESDFFCAIMSSIAGHLPSPLFSVYGASKAALCKFIESVNIELEKTGHSNRILDVSPGKVEGTRFYGGTTDLQLTSPLADSILREMFARNKLYIPGYDTIYKNVLDRYRVNPQKFGSESYDYKLRGERPSRPQVKVGYLSGTFDLFHIGHLNILRKAKAHCDYLVVGVHRDATHKGKKAFIPYEERVDIVSSVRYVDKVIQSPSEDSEAYDLVKYDYLFVGTDYKGSERFKRYEEYFRDTGVEIIYLPYTLRTNSTELRTALTVLSHGG